ncbi:MAG: hypothetical protein WCG83_00845 [Candidatus Peregrinibacteria bacterium]
MNIPEKFLEANRAFWLKYASMPSRHLLLLEESKLGALAHVHGVCCVLLHQSRGLTPCCLGSDKDADFYRSFVPVAQSKTISPITKVFRIYLIITSAFKFLHLWWTGNILGFSYDGIRYGDLIYDEYLARFQVATIRRIDFGLFRIIRDLLVRHQKIYRTLRSDSFEAALVSHQVGIRSGVILRVALKYGYHVYLCNSLQDFSLIEMRSTEDAYNSPYAPTRADINTILRVFDDEKMGKAFRYEFDRQVTGKGNINAAYAYSSKNKLYANREEFSKDFGLDCTKKNIFIMLHAMTDFPHSHFRSRMLFRDYYDWFYRTLIYAKTDTSVNWIFKQHPSIAYYPTKDVDFDALFEEVPPNVVFISGDHQIDTRSLSSCADCIITCLGSAGFELPAMAGIPSIVAGESEYSGYGFTLEPKSIPDYFRLLSTLHKLPSLTQEQGRRAQAMYLYTHKLCLGTLSCCKNLSLHEQKSGQSDPFWNAILELYERKKDTIYSEMREYISQLSLDACTKLPPFDISLHKFMSEIHSTAPELHT